MGILDKADVDALLPAERWHCRACGRNGFSMNKANASRRVDPCPDCGGDMAVWPSGERENLEKVERCRDDGPLALRLLRGGEA